MDLKKVAFRHKTTAGQWLGPLDMYLYECLYAAGRHGYGAMTLGMIENWPIVLLIPPSSDAPRMLVAAGFHGNEPAGCWGILEVLKSGANLAGVSFLPAANPTGLDIGIRYNRWNETTNGGFCRGEEPSREGKVLVANLDLLKDCARDGFLTVHEDEENKGTYAYAYGQKSVILAQQMLDPSMFPIGDWVITSRSETMEIKNGIIADYSDGSFENLLYESGVPISICTEVPAQADKVRRTLACKAYVEFFINGVRSCKTSSL